MVYILIEDIMTTVTNCSHYKYFQITCQGRRKILEKKTTNTRKIRAIETKNKIYKSAEQLFRKYDFENVSVDSIVHLAGVSKGAFYVHFDSKIALIAELIADYVNKLDLDYRTYTDSFPTSTTMSDILISLAGKIADIISCTIGYNLIKIAYEVQISRTVNTEIMLGYNRDLYKVVKDVISKGVHRCEFRTDIPVDTMTTHYILALRGLTVEWCLRYPDFNLKDQVEKHFKILMTGIKQ